MQGVATSDAPAAHNKPNLDVGEWYTGRIVYAASWDGTSYDGDRRETKIRIDVETEDGLITDYATLNNNLDGDGYPNRKARAWARAVEAVGAKSIEVGGTITTKRAPDVATPRGNAHDWKAKYEPPAQSVDMSSGSDVDVDDLV